MMANTGYSAPGVDVIIERGEVEIQSAETQFYNVYIGTGITSRNRNIEKNNLKANVSNFPLVELTFNMLGEINTDLFSKMSFTVGQVSVLRSTVPEGEEPEITLDPETDYSVEAPVSFSTYDSTAKVTLRILNETITANDAIYNINILAEMSDKDFDLRAIGTEDRFFSKELFGPIVLKEMIMNFIMISLLLLRWHLGWKFHASIT